MPENTTAITTQPEILTPAPLTPAEDVKRGVECATALMTILDKKEKPVVINGKKYADFTEWQTLGRFFNVSVRTKEAEPVEIDGIKGAKAKSDLIDTKTGLIIGGAEAYCMRDERNWKDKPWFQLASMAQTRSGVKSLRNHLSWVMVLANIQPTPAEEMDIDDIGKVFDAEPAGDGEPFPSENSKNEEVSTQDIEESFNNAMIDGKTHKEYRKERKVGEKCPDCGLGTIILSKQGKPYCDQKCWLNK